MSCNHRFRTHYKHSKLTAAVKSYIFGKQTYKQLQAETGKDHKTIRKHIDSIDVQDKELVPRTCVLAFDTTFFGELSVSLIRDITNGENLIWRFGDSEVKWRYADMYLKIIEAKIIPIAIVVDGREFFFEMFADIPVQMCHFHMGKILARHLTRRPNLQLNKDLWSIWYDRKKHRENTLRGMLTGWYNRYRSELEEVGYDQFNGRRYYVKERTRKAYFSLLRFLPWLFTYQKSKWIPETNNSIEGTFSNLKSKIRVHTGLSIGRKMKIIHELLK